MTPVDLPEYRVHTRQSPLERARTAIEIVAVIATAVWALYVFVYQERIRPAIEGPRVEFVPIVTHAPLGRDLELVTVTDEMRNVGNVSAEVAGFVENVTGFHYGDRSLELGDKGLGARSNTHMRAYSVPADRLRTIYRREQLHSPFGSNPRLPILPGATLRLGASIVLKRGEFDAVQVTYAFCYTMDGANAIARAETREPGEGKSYDVFTFASDAAKKVGARCARFGRGGRPIDPI